MMAGAGREHVIEPARKSARVAFFREEVGDVLDETLAVDLAEQRRRLAHQHGAGAERLERQAERRKFVERRRKRVHARLVEIDDGGDQQHLSRDAGLLALAFELLVDEALMRRVLVDDDEAVARLRDDVGFVQLRARGAERRLAAPAPASSCARASAIGAPASKAACGWSSKPAGA